MLVCEECNHYLKSDKAIIWKGKVLCMNCAIELLIHMLETLNIQLVNIQEVLEIESREA